MKSESQFRPLALAAIITYAVALYANPSHPELAGYAYAALFALAYFTMRFSFTGDVKEISLIMFLTPTFVLYFSPLLMDDFEMNYRQRFGVEQIGVAARLAFIGYCAYIAGHHWARRFTPKPVLKNLRTKEIPPEALALASGAMMALSVAHLAFPAIFDRLKASLGRIVFVIDQLPMLALALGAMAFLRGYRNPLYKALLFMVFLPVEVAAIVARTLFYHLVILFAPLIAMWMLWKKRAPWLLALAPIIILAPAFKMRIQERVKHGWGDEFTATELIATGVDRIIGAWRLGDEETVKTRDSLTRQRLNSLSLLAHCVYQHREFEKPFKKGSTFWFLPLSPIPRIIFPWKPKNDHGLTFGEEYGLRMHEENFAVVLPLLVESYINGGLLGVILISFAVGAMYYLCFAFFEHGKGSFNLLALLTVVYFIVYVENNITILFGGAAQAMALWWVVDRNWRFFIPSWAVTRKLAESQAGA